MNDHPFTIGGLMVVAVTAICGSVAFAAGWHDYELPIDSDYSIVRANTLDVMLCQGPHVLLPPMDEPHVGPIVAYAVNDQFIFTRHIGRKLRNLFAGDTFEDPDPSQEFFFITRKADAHVTGPFTSSEFRAKLEMLSAETIAWRTPKNPNVLGPLLGSLMFVLIVAFYFSGPLFLVLLLLLLPFLIILRKRQRAHIAAHRESSA